MTHTTHRSTQTLTVPGARLYYEVRGAGPTLAVIGSPMAAGEFSSLADALAERHTVITYDPRGISGSRVDDPSQDSTPELRADDVIALLDAVGADTADVFGSSGGAVTGLALAARYPGRIRTLVAHEPPLLELLPDAAEQRAKTDDVVETFHRHGVAAAWMKFMANAGFDVGGDGAPAPAGEPTEEELRNGARFFDHELRPSAHYVPDIAALKNGPTRVLVGIGADSGHLVTHATSTALAELLGSAPALFPGDHGGFLSAPREFADRLTAVLTG
ncbi:MAG: putative hydrolase [Mycobacterium sp.]|jgi:pimeloyl-ACP methyl ester carboxylesterase|nr:putative hydrolase [Mycobacterium sp.]